MGQVCLPYPTGMFGISGYAPSVDDPCVLDGSVRFYELLLDPENMAPVVTPEGGLEWPALGKSCECAPQCLTDVEKACISEEVDLLFEAKQQDLIDLINQLAVFPIAPNDGDCCNKLSVSFNDGDQLRTFTDFNNDGHLNVNLVGDVLCDTVDEEIESGNLDSQVFRTGTKFLTNGSRITGVVIDGKAVPICCNNELVKCCIEPELPITYDQDNNDWLVKGHVYKLPVCADTAAVYTPSASTAYEGSFGGDVLTNGVNQPDLGSLVNGSLIPSGSISGASGNTVATDYNVWQGNGGTVLASEVSSFCLNFSTSAGVNEFGVGLLDLDSGVWSTITSIVAPDGALYTATADSVAVTASPAGDWEICFAIPFLAADNATGMIQSIFYGLTSESVTINDVVVESGLASECTLETLEEVAEALTAARPDYPWFVECGKVCAMLPAEESDQQ